MHDDELIDRAAHAMTRGEPSARLRQAVRVRIDNGTQRLWIPALTSVAALVVLAATMVWMPRSGRQATSPASAVVTPPPAVVSRVEPRVVESPAATPPASAPPVRRAPRPAPRIAVIDPLLIEPLSVPLMTVETNSGAMPMEIQPLQIEPLQPQ